MSMAQLLYSYICVRSELRRYLRCFSAIFGVKPFSHLFYRTEGLRDLHVTHAFPCRNTKSDRRNAQEVEAEISRSIDKEKITLVGWYHSHPFAAAAPTLRDVDAQLDYQIRMKGSSDNNYMPCIGMIISPYSYENNSLESSIISYWVIPPPETKPNEYGRPMLMSYSVIQDSLITTNVKEEIKRCVEYYKKERDFINFNERYLNNNLYIDKLKNTLLSKFPRDENETVLWCFIKDAVGHHTEENDCLLSIPSISKSPLLPNLNSSLSSNLILQSDISNILFNSGKFPTASSLLGLPDPMAHSTLAANNIFLSTNLFKMQELLKPLSSNNNTMQTKMKSDLKRCTSLKIPTDIKGKSEFAVDLLNLKNKLDFIAPDLNLSKSDFSVSDLNSKTVKQELYIADSNISLNRNTDLGERSLKIPKSDFNTIDLSICKNSNEVKETATDLTIPSDNRNEANWPTLYSNFKGKRAQPTTARKTLCKQGDGEIVPWTARRVGGGSFLTPTRRKCFIHYVFTPLFNWTFSPCRWSRQPPLPSSVGLRIASSLAEVGTFGAVRTLGVWLNWTVHGSFAEHCCDIILTGISASLCTRCELPRMPFGCGNRRATTRRPAVENLQTSVAT
ncbi:hypothetical protein Zmor_018279 [Zophobas morio]|uniref:MPN domain-containing protein n=1 Tax=Zophobas morio TaxID=2755281 RepID=A0AA38IDM2_9CUCU|nr:hypothetical protein Zmor_018279 [Zophobas morio]